MKVKAAATTDFNSDKDFKRFQKAVATFNKRVNRTRESARQQLIDEGIYTKSLKLSKHYR